MLTVLVDIDGVEHKFDTLAHLSSDLAPVLRRFGAHLRRRAADRYAAQDMEPLAAATVAKRAQRGLRAFESKLTGDVRRAQRKTQEQAPRGVLARLFGLGGARDIGSGSRAVQSRLAVLAEFQARHGRRTELAARGGLKPLSFKQTLSIGAREDRAVAKAVGAPILGKLAGSLVVEVDGANVTLTSRTKGEWSAVHNDGGTAGRGARIPQRETIKIEEQDLELFAELLKEHHLAAFDGNGIGSG